MKLVTVIHFASVVLVCVRADYEVEVRLYRYWNTEHRRSNGDCCDGRMMCGDHSGDRCENLLTVCVSDRNFDPDNPPDGCVTGDESRVRNNNDDIRFDVGADALQGLPNPLVFTVTGAWPSDPPRTLRVRADDIDEDGIEPIGQIIIDLASLNSGDSVGAMQYNRTWDAYPEGIHVNLSLTLRCSENYYGLDCNRLCVDTDSELGHYTCDENGTIVCNEGYRNTSTNCTECVPAEGCSDVGGYCERPNDCKCQPLYTGTLCEIDLDPCGHTLPCENGAMCRNSGDGDFNCTCAEEFEGESCQFNATDECDPDPCQNGATCVDLFRDYMCLCVEGSGYNGKNCSDQELRDDSTTDSESASSSSSSPAALAGGVVGIAALVLVILVLVVVLALVLNRKKRHKVTILKKSVPSDYEEFVKSGSVGPSFKPPSSTGTNTASSAEHEFDNPIYGDGQDEEYAIPVKLASPPPSSSTDPSPHEYDYTVAPSGVDGPKPVYESADDPSTAIPQSMYSYADPSGGRKTQEHLLMPPVTEHDYAMTEETDQPLYDDVEQSGEPVATVRGSGSNDFAGHYEFGQD